MSIAVFILHPTFRNPKVFVNQAPFRLCKVGWGYFELPITVHFKKATGILDPQTFEHTLSFDGDGKHRKFVLTVNKNRILPKPKAAPKQPQEKVISKKVVPDPKPLPKEANPSTI